MKVTPANCFMWLVSLRKTEAGLRRRNDCPLQLRVSGRKSKCVTPPKGRKAGETHSEKRKVEIGRTRRKISQNGAREKIAPSWGICGKKKQTKIEESECTFSFHCARKKKQSLFRAAATSRSQRPKSHYTKNRPGRRRGGRRAAFVIASSDNRCIPIPITSSHTIIDEAAYLIFLLHFQPTAVEGEREREAGDRASDERRNYRNH